MIQKLEQHRERGSMPIAMLLVVFTGFVSMLTLSLLAMQVATVSGEQAENYSTTAADSGLATASQAIAGTSKTACSLVTTAPSTWTSSAPDPLVTTARLTPAFTGTLNSNWSNYWSTGGVTWSGTNNITATIPPGSYATFMSNPALNRGMNPTVAKATLIADKAVSVNFVAKSASVAANAVPFGSGSASVGENNQMIQPGTSNLSFLYTPPGSSYTYSNFWFRVTNAADATSNAVVTFTDMGAYQIPSYANPPSASTQTPMYRWWADRVDVNNGLLYATVQAQSGDPAYPATRSSVATYRWNDTKQQWLISGWQSQATAHSTTPSGSAPSCP